MTETSETIALQLTKKESQITEKIKKLMKTRRKRKESRSTSIESTTTNNIKQLQLLQRYNYEKRYRKFITVSGYDKRLIFEIKEFNITIIKTGIQKTEA